MADFSKVLFCLISSLPFLTKADKNRFYEFTVDDIEGKKFFLKSLKGKVSLVVNVASECGYTDSHYKELTSLHDELSVKRSEPFTVLAFPCNQFGEQEPDDNAEIEAFVRNTYGAKFPIFSKLNVVGVNAHSAYLYLKDASGIEPTWNFWKYLIDDDGEFIDAWGPRVSIESIKPTVLKAIEQAKLKHKEL